MKRVPSACGRVLIVDDDRDTREMYSESLKADGFDAIPAASGEEALRLASKIPPTVVVTDLRLSGKIDGLELARRLRADDRTAAAKIILLTGALFDGDRQDAGAAGCDRFLIKPCLPDALASEIRNVAASRAVRPASRDQRRKA